VLLRTPFMQEPTQLSTEIAARDDFVASQPQLLGARAVRALVWARWLYGAYFLLAGLYKLFRGLLWTGELKEMFVQRLTEIPPTSFAALYLTEFGIPMNVPITWVVVIGQLSVGVGCLAGIALRLNMVLGLFIAVNIGLGGFYNPALIPFLVLPVLVLMFPATRAPGLDARLSARYPNSILFR
jgi:uncharacterized membrane protein YphA (DoxX/SURF4 family)